MSNLWYPFTAMQDWSKGSTLSIEAGEGNYLIASDGRRYLDGVSSLWTNVHGHNHPHLNQAIKDQVDRISHSTLLGLSNPPAERLASRLVDITPKGLNHVFYSDSGSTAVEIALKQAFQYWQLIGKPEKTRLAHIDEAYHGDTLGAVAVGGIDLFHQVYGPLLLDTLSIPCPNSYKRHCNTNQGTAERESLTALQTLFQESASQTAALIIEPLVQGAGGILTHSPAYLSKVAALCTDFDVLLILDEVATGFGRTGTLFAAEQAGITPDLMCLAKGISGGYLPLAATLSTDRIYDAFLAPRVDAKTFFHGHTYTGNALACAAGLANLEIFEREATISKLPAKIDHLATKLATLKQHPHVGNIRQCGLMVGVEIIADRTSNTPYPTEYFMGDQICLALRSSHQVILRNLSDVIVLMPPLSILTSEIDLMIDALHAGIEAACP
jgi:adenosylmethionine-8-amino-7-oxononanoate aminotransferase